MKTVGAAETRIDLGLALALPCLVVLSSCAPLLGLAFGSLSPWAVAGAELLAGIVLCTYLLRERGRARALGIATSGVVAGVGCFALAIAGLNVLADSTTQGNDASNTIATGIPLLVVVLTVVAIVWSWRVFRGHRLVLAVAWAVAVATPILLSTPVSALSDAAGHAGMDVVGLLVDPLAAFLVWAFLVATSLLWPSGAPNSKLEPGPERPS